MPSELSMPMRDEAGQPADRDSMIVLSEARSVKFTGFVTPGHELRLTVEQIKREGAFVHFKFQGEVDGRLCVSGRLSLECYNLADDDPDRADLDTRMIAYQRSIEPMLTRDLSLTAATT